MLTLCRAVKGGSGTTVVTALAGLTHRGPSLLVDLDDDLGMALGLPPSPRPGAAEWLRSDAPPEHLDDLLVEVDRSTWLLPTRSADGAIAELDGSRVVRWMQLASWCRSWTKRSVGLALIDAGQRAIPEEFVAACDHRWLVTRPCYLALQRAASTRADHTGIIVVDEPGRSLSTTEIEHAGGAPVLATVQWEPTVARATDAGLIASGRLDRHARRSLERVVGSSIRAVSVA